MTIEPVETEGPTLFGGSTAPLHGLGDVLLDALAFRVQTTKVALSPGITLISVEARTCPPIRGAGLGDDVKKLHGRYPDTIPAEESQEMDDNLRVSAR